MTLRARLLATLAFTAALPILLFSWAVNERLARVAGEEQERRLAAAAASLRPRLEAARGRLLRPLERVRAALPALEQGKALQQEWSRLAENNRLELLEAVGPDGRVLASHHWPAGYQLPDDDRVVDDELGLRVQRVAEGHGYVERLTLTAEAEASWQGRPVRIRGGLIVDGPLLAEWSAAAGAELALVLAGAHERWSAGSALAAASLAGLERGKGGDAALRWSAHRLSPRLFAVAAAPATGAEAALATDLRRLALAFAGLAVLFGIAAALLLSSGIVRPLERLSQASQRVAAGELSAGVPAEGADEIAELGRSFNEMVADLRRAQVRLVQAGRVAVWRDLARRLAHELKNPLFPIQISVETLRRAYEKERAGSPEFRKLFEELTATLLSELQSLRRIVEDFAGFARMPEPRPVATDLNALVARVLDLHAARAAGVRVERRLAPELKPVPADPDLLSRALANLVLNAIEAMPDGGTLTLATRALPRHAEIAVSDTGGGVDERQLFQPYYTTKPGGTGLGLVIAQGIVSDHRGELDVESAPGRGTTFRLRLPLVAPP